MTEIISNPTPPILKGPSDKEKKYDRQLRLWAAAGQKALEDAHILLVNSGAGTVGVETLKNLVLPGIGKFTIADDSKVNEADLGVNFFLDEDSLGKSRAESCVRLLQELNPDVESDWFPKQEGEFLDSLLKQQFTLIMFSFPIEPTSLALLQAYGRTHNVPLVSLHSAGFFSYFQTHLPGTFPIVDTHPDSTATTDLRLLTPWQELSTFVAELTDDMESQTEHKHGHIPYLVLLLHYLGEWKAIHGSYPSNYKEKTAFRTLVRDSARTNNSEGGEENFDEAVAAVLKTVSSPTLSSSVKEVFEYQPNEVESKSSFWIIAKAIKKFYIKHNELPLPGAVPDMKAESEIYVRLQNIYKAKARADVAEVLETVVQDSNGSNVDASEVEAFCKNAAFIKLVYPTNPSASTLRSLAEKEFKQDQENLDLSETLGQKMPLSLLPIYLALKATSHAPLADSTEIVGIINKEIPGAAANPQVQEAAEEVARAQGGELHNISSLTGGMVAQEVIKIITKQYIPIDNTSIFDGISSRAQVFRI